MNKRRIRLFLKNNIAIIIGGLFLIGVGYAAYYWHQADARRANGFNPGNIMSDAVMSNYRSMSVVDIQNFLNAKVPHCDTYGQGESPWRAPDYNNSGKTERWEWGKYKEGVTTFTCLKDYKDGSGRSAAQLIYDKAQKYKINPQVLIVLLQKEQNLVLDTWPMKVQYKSATGYACPDTAPCDSKFFGLDNQLEWAAKMFRAILNRSSGWYVPYRVGTNTIQWNPNESCGTSQVNIENLATVALYSYTPYRPNQAALNAGYGSGDGCSAYGNRNFYLYFTDWFGDTNQGVVLSSPLEIISQNTTTLTPNKEFEARFKIRNNTRRVQNIGKMIVAVRDESGRGHDFGLKEVVLNPGQEYVYSAKTTFTTEGKYKFFISNYQEKFGWDPKFPTSERAGMAREFYRDVKRPLEVSNLKLTKSAYANSTLSVSFTIRNLSQLGYDLEKIRLVINDDFKNSKASDEVLLAGNQTKQYQLSTVAGQTGRYRLKLQYKLRQQHDWFDFVAGNSTLQFDVKPSLTLTQGLSITPTRVGQIAKGSFAIKNHSDKVQSLNGRLCYIIRGPQGQNFDLGCIEDKTIAPGQTITFQGQRKLDVVGRHRAYFSTQLPGDDWRAHMVYPAETGKEARTLQFDVNK